MRLTHPWWLLVALVAVPVFAAAWLGRRRSSRAAVAWGNPAVFAGLQQRRQRTRLAAPALALAALAAATGALAGPEFDTIDRERSATAVLVIDVSRSMEAGDVEPTRLDAAQAAARTFLDEVPDYVRVGVVSFSGEVATLVSPTTDREEARRAVATLRTADGTALGDAIRAGLVPARIDPDDTNRPNPVTVVLLSDGANTVGSDPTEAAGLAQSLGVVVHTIALGTATGVVDLFDPSTGQVVQIAVPPDVDTLADIAQTTDGTFYDVADADTLQQVYGSIADTIVPVNVARPLWRELVAASVTLAAAAAAVAAYRRRFP